MLVTCVPLWDCDPYREYGQAGDAPLTLRIYRPLGNRTITSVARCSATVARVSGEGGGFVLDLDVAESAVADQLSG